MSRIGRKPIVIPAGVDVKIDGSTVTVKGPKGTLSRTVHQNMNVAVEDGVIHVTRPDDNKLNRSLHGLTRTLVANMVEGVEKGFSKELEINGVGYRAVKEGQNLVMHLGFSHTVTVSENADIQIDVPNHLTPEAEQKLREFEHACGLNKNSQGGPNGRSAA